MEFINGVALSAYSDLLRMLRDSTADAGVSVRCVERGGKLHWYRTTKLGKDAKWLYIGPDDEATRAVAARMQREHEMALGQKKERGRLARILRAEGLASIDQATGSFLLAASRLGLFHLGVTVIGELALRVSEASVGARLPGDLSDVGRTDDEDHATIHLHVLSNDDGRLRDALSELRLSRADGHGGGAYWWKRASKPTLVRFYGSQVEGDDGLQLLDDLGVVADVDSGLGYLLKNAAWQVALYREGVLIRAPRAERFAMHALAMADRHRQNGDHATADGLRARAGWVIQALAETDPGGLWDAYEEAL